MSRLGGYSQVERNRNVQAASSRLYKSRAPYSKYLAETFNLNKTSKKGPKITSRKTKITTRTKPFSEAQSVNAYRAISLGNGSSPHSLELMRL